MRTTPFAALFGACTGTANHTANDKSSEEGDTSNGGDGSDGGDGGSEPSPCGSFFPWDQAGGRWTYGLKPESYSFTMTVVVEARGAEVRDGREGFGFSVEGEYDIPELYDYFRRTDDEVRFCEGGRTGVLYQRELVEQSTDGRPTTSTVERVFTGTGEWMAEPAVGDSWEADLSYDNYIDGEFIDHYEDQRSYRVVGETAVTVPAGTLTVLDVEVDGGVSAL